MFCANYAHKSVLIITAFKQSLSYVYISPMFAVSLKFLLPSFFLSQLDMLTTFIKLQMSLVHNTKDGAVHLDEKKTDQSIFFSSLPAVK